VQRADLGLHRLARSGALVCFLLGAGEGVAQRADFDVHRLARSGALPKRCPRRQRAAKSGIDGSNLIGSFARCLD